MSLELRIDPDIHALFEGLYDEQIYQALKADIAENEQSNIGVVAETPEEYRGVIVCGEKRYNICQELGIEFLYVLHKFESKDEMIEYAKKDNVLRRQLDSFERIIVEQRYIEMLVARSTPKGGRPRKTVSDDTVTGRTRKIIADLTGVSETTVARALKIMKDTPKDKLPEITRQIKLRKTTINREYKRILADRKMKVTIGEELYSLKEVKTRFKIKGSGLRMIADLTYSMNLEVVLRILPTEIVVHQYDAAESRALIIEYPIEILEDKMAAIPTDIAVSTDHLYEKAKLFSEEEIVCEVDEKFLRLIQGSDVKGVIIIQDHKIDLESEPVQDVWFDDEPKISGTVFCELPDVSIFKEVISAISSSTFYISASKDQLVLESYMDCGVAPSKMTISTPSIINDENNQTRHSTSEIKAFVNALKDTSRTTIIFAKDDTIIIESVGEDIKAKLYFAPISAQ